MVMLGGIIVLGAFGGILYFGLANSPTRALSLAYHWHVKLTVEDLRLDPKITNNNLTIPGNIGVPGGLWANDTLDQYGGLFGPDHTISPDGKRFASLHTQDTSGTIHIETTALRLFTLADFFYIWGVPLEEGCVWDYCSSPSQGLAPPIMATKHNDWTEGCIDRGYLLRDGDEILILIGASSIPARCV